jgi:hypothetical protein
MMMMMMTDDYSPSQLTGTTGGEEPVRLQTFSVVFGKHLS